jgi:hypothetical protein
MCVANPVDARKKFSFMMLTVRDLLTPESLFHLTAIAFIFYRLFTAGRVSDLSKHDKKSTYGATYSCQIK